MGVKRAVSYQGKKSDGGY